MQIKELGHVVLYVTDLQKMVNFYHGLLGFNLIKHQKPIALFSSGRTHHELLLIEIGLQYQKHQSIQPGLYHIGFKIGDTDQELKQAYQELQVAGVTIIGSADHHVTHSLYVLDPDGNELELYIDTGIEWQNNPEEILKPAKHLRL